MITVSTDGSALGNPNGAMGWAWCDHKDNNTTADDNHQHPHDYDAGGAPNGTNQIGELCAVLEALRAHRGSEPLTIETDSQYAINCSTVWVHGWKKNGWQNSQKKPVKNKALIEAIDEEIQKRQGPVTFVWVKGHAGNAGNERVDSLAHGFADDCKAHQHDGYLPLEGWQALLDSPYAQHLELPSAAQDLLDGNISADEYKIQASPAYKNLEAHNVIASKNNISEQDSVDSTDHSPEILDESTTPAVEDENSENVSSITVAESSELQENANSPEHSEILNSGTQKNLSDHVSAQTANQVNQAESAQEESAQISQAQPVEAQSETNQTENIQPEITHRQSKSTGLNVSGALRFTPPPNSSPTYNGQPRRVQGYVRVDGYVDGDGNITIENAPFFMNA